MPNKFSSYKNFTVNKIILTIFRFTHFISREYYNFWIFVTSKIPENNKNFLFFKNIPIKKVIQNLNIFGQKSSKRNKNSITYENYLQWTVFSICIMKVYGFLIFGLLLKVPDRVWLKILWSQNRSGRTAKPNWVPSWPKRMKRRAA